MLLVVLRHVAMVANILLLAVVVVVVAVAVGVVVVLLLLFLFLFFFFFSSFVQIVTVKIPIINLFTIIWGFL